MVLSCITLYLCVSTFIRSVTALPTDHQLSPTVNLRDNEMLQKGLLSRLGLTEVPKLARPALPVPAHVWSLYNDVVEEQVDSDWIRYFYPSEMLEENNGLLLSFNLSLSVFNSTEERVDRAVIKMKIRNPKKHGRIQVFLDEDTKYPGQLRRLLDSVAIDPESGKEYIWRDLDVTDAIRQMESDTVFLRAEFSEGNSIFYSPQTESLLSTIAHSFRQSVSLVVFSDSTEPSRVRRKRETREGRKNRNKNRKHHKMNAERGLCQKKNMHIYFEELGWNEWILAPDSYEAGQCVGGCPHPIPDHLNATNHAIIQSLLHSLNPQIPAPCCVPTETSPLAILYMEKENRITIKNYAGMRVESCGCR